MDRLCMGPFARYLSAYCAGMAENVLQTASPTSDRKLKVWGSLSLVPGFLVVVVDQVFP